MHGTRKSKTSVRGSTTDLVSANDANIAPGLGAVSTSNIFAGGRTRKGARANDDRSGKSEKGSAGDKRVKAGGKACGNQSGNDNAVESANVTIAKAGGKACCNQSDNNAAVASTNNHNNSIAKAGGKARGSQSGNDNALESANNHNNCIAKAVGKAPDNQSGNDDAMESANNHNNCIAKAGAKAPGNQSGNDDAVAINQSGNDDAVASSDYTVASADYQFKTHGSGRSGRTRKPPAKQM